MYQLDAALEDPQTQRCGLVFIYDMSDSKYSNFDYDLSIKILSLLKVRLRMSCEVVHLRVDYKLFEAVGISSASNSKFLFP